MRFVWGVTCSAGLVAQAADAWACSPLTSTVKFVGDSLPSDGATEVPLNAGLVFHEVDSGRVGAGGGFALHSISVVPRGGQAVDGRQPVRIGQALTWAPTAPLLPNTAYDVVVRSGASGDIEVVEKEELIEDYAFSFTTGTQLLPKLAFAGELTVDFEVGEMESFPIECTNPCGGSSIAPCEPEGRYAVVHAIVHVPAVTGGHAAAGYRGVVDYTLDAPSGLDAFASRPPSEVLRATQYFDVDAEQLSGVVFSVGAGTPCFQVAVSDSGGQSAVASVCAPEVDVRALVDQRNAEISARGEAPPQVNDQPTTNPTPPGNTNSDPDGVAQSEGGAPIANGCTITRAPSERTSTRGFLLLGLLAAALGARRRVTSSARE